ncbi:neurogenic locus notch-like protein 1 [Elysia marginata]|uniref:Neurogenic locus notch-like protein 1 n=1 Tax=Elysia marginata TaxID=1093978 RepID=A0AAV4K0A2_9GAST|nr:neurogenic locus notch-like protein 1 [Elysia marginata]
MPLDHMLTIVRQRKLKSYGHTTGYRKWKQKKRWEDNIREWTGLELRNTLRKAEDIEEWKAMVRRPSAAPRRIPNLSDRVLGEVEKGKVDTSELDPCDLISCHNGGKCKLQSGHPYCQCSDGFSGYRCETCEIISRNPCDCLKCENGGACESPDDRPRCRCPTGWMGTYCEIRDTRDPCDDYKCKNRGKCKVIDGSPKCVCKDGYYGRRCQNDYCGGCSKNERCMKSDIVCVRPPCPQYQCKPKDPCKTFICQNGGRCTVYKGVTQCVCPRDYKGLYCQKKKNPCKHFGCKNGGRCKAIGGRPSCICPSGYTGKRCKRDLCGGCKKKEKCVFNGTYECQNRGRA